MADLTGDQNGTFTDKVRQLETTDPRHPDTWNPNNQTLITNDVVLKVKQDTQQSEIETARGGKTNVNARMTEIETNISQIQVDTNLVSQHTKSIDSIHNFSHEKLIYDILADVEQFDVEVAVANDNTIDLASTTGVIESQSYFLIEGETVEEIRVASVLNSTRFTSTQNLANNFTTAAIMKRASGALLITKQHPGKACYLFVKGSSDLAVNVFREDGSNWTAVSAESNGGYRSYGPVRFKIEVTTGTLTKVGLSGLPVLQDLDSGNTKQYVLEIEDGTLIQREV